MPVRLCYVSGSEIPSPRAHNVQVMKMCAAFASHGVQAELVIPARPGARHLGGPKQPDVWAWYGVPNSFRLTRLPYPNLGSAINRRTSKLVYPLTAALYVELRRPDFVYTRKLWVAYWLARWRRPAILEVHDGVLGPKHVAFVRFAALARGSRFLRGIVANCQATADMYIAAGFPAAKACVLHNGVNLESFAAFSDAAAARRHLGLPSKRHIVCYAGNLRQGQGSELLLECARLYSEALFLFVGGQPDDLSRLQSLVATQGIVNALFVGPVPNAQVPAYLQAADALVMPYTSRVPHIHSISPMKLFEYMAAARPIVSSDFPAIREVLAHERNALLVEPDSAHAMLAGLRRVLSDPGFAARIAQQARQDVQAYTWSSRAAKVLQWFTQDAPPRPER